jgi:DeoR/GlpR family transcriptional regulator of sugar metabolism
MLKEERLDFILQKLKANQVVKLTDLSTSLQVSEDTIRRDIETLDRNGLCLKVRGGAVPHSPNKKAQ